MSLQDAFDKIFGSDGYTKLVAMPTITRECVDSECYECPWETSYNASPCDCDCHTHIHNDNEMATFEPCYFGYGDLYLYAMSYSYAVTDAQLAVIDATVDKMKLVADKENDV